MTANRQNRPPCFGDLDTVFPEGDDNFRHSPETCLKCLHKTECLRAAMKGSQGLRVREDTVDRAYASGMMSFFERWSKKKELDVRRKARQKSGANR